MDPSTHIMNSIPLPVVPTEPAFAFDSYFGSSSSDTSHAQGIPLGGNLPPLEMDVFFGGTGDLFGDMGWSQMNPKSGMLSNIEPWPHLPEATIVGDDGYQQAGRTFKPSSHRSDILSSHTQTHSPKATSPGPSVAESPLSTRSKRRRTTSGDPEETVYHDSPTAKRSHVASMSASVSSSDSAKARYSRGQSIDGGEDDERRAASNASARARRSQEAGLVDTFRTCLDLDPTVKRTDVFKCVLNALSHRITLKVDLDEERQTVQRLRDEKATLKRWIDMRERWWRERMRRVAEELNRVESANTA